MRTLIVVLCLLTACTEPPSTAYVGAAATPASGATGVALGPNASGESCSQLPSGIAGSVDIYCGTWQLPAARVRDEGPAPAAGLMALATTGPWRDGLDLLYICETAVNSSILGGAPAVLLRCKRRVGGWPQLGLAASVDGRVYLADGILPSLPVMERSIGVMSGRVAGGANALPRSSADTLLANQLAARAFGAGDVGEYEQLMAVGARANLGQNFAAAETVDRAALALQQKALGRGDPDTVNALMALALQVSDQGRFAESDLLFQQADTLAPRANDRVAVARLLHYRALDALNQGHTEQALGLLARAETDYSAQVPPEVLRAGNAAQPLVLASAGSTAGELADLPSQRLMVDPAAQSALMGLIETLRYRAIALRRLGRTDESAQAIAAAERLASANRMTVPLVAARLIRTAATTEAASGTAGSAIAALALSRQDFSDVLPQTRPVAETALLQAGEYARRDQPERAIALCRTAVALLRALSAGTDPSLLEPCLGAYAAAAGRDKGQNQALLAEMFETAQLAQGSVTSRQIGEAAARLAASTRDPRVAEAIRRRQDAAQALAELYRERDLLARPPVPGTPRQAIGAASAADVDKSVVAAQTELADADAALQAAAPNYGQLVQEVVPAADVLAALAPGEAFAAITLTPHGGWTFLLRDGAITGVPVHGDAGTIAAEVRKLRANIELTATLPEYDVATARALYDDTLGAAAVQLDGAKALVVAPSGPLLALPFAVLLTGPATPDDLAAAPWLIRRMSISHVPSAANFVALRKAGSSRAPRPWFGFGGFRPPTLTQARASCPTSACSDSAALLAALPPLPSAQRELDAARLILGGAPSDELLNAAFTADAVRHVDLRNYRIMHFATHALLPTELRCEDQPAIVTSTPAGASDASGALLTASDVFGLQLDANLVILSACNSGGPGGSTAGESLSGLARAFFYAGARSLLVTHWAVNDQAAAYLVVDTLNRLHQSPGLGVAAAMQGAELAMLDAAGHGMPAEVAQPFFWAPFAVIGNGSGVARVATAAR